MQVIGKALGGDLKVRLPDTLQRGTGAFWPVSVAINLLLHELEEGKEQAERLRWEPHVEARPPETG